MPEALGWMAEEGVLKQPLRMPMPRLEPMITQVLRSGLVGLALLLQVVAATGAAQYFVVCVGPAGHVAVEDYEAASRCRASESGLGAEVFAGFSIVGARSVCVDTALFGASPEGSTSLLRAPALVVATAVVALPDVEVAPRRAVWSQDPPGMSTRVLRSVVLLI